METEKIKKTISLSDVANVKDTFELAVRTNSVLLEEWEKANYSMNTIHLGVLEQARLELSDYWNHWNKEELKMKFISVVMRAAEIEIPEKANVFYERPMIGTINEYDFSVICDCMIASPTPGGRPKTPYFFLQEYKKEKADQIDPEAQMLIAMLLAQELNKDSKPLYGSWVRGESWHFAVLQNKEYCVSKGYIATHPFFLEKIVSMIHELRTLILGR